MLCSTIIPTVGRDTLERAVLSALEQDIEPNLHEILIVNDSGTPLKPFDWLESPQIKLVTTNRSGVSFACNAGAAMATGKYLKFLHDDDYLLPGALQALIKVGETTDSSWIVGGQRVVDAKGEKLFEQRHHLSGNEFVRFIAGGSLHISPCLIRRDLFMQVGGFDPGIKRAEDRDLACRMALLGEFASSEYIVACVRKANAPGSMFQNQSEKAAWTRLIRERTLNTPGAYRRVINSVQTKKNNSFLRGWVCRTYLFSAILNSCNGQVLLALSRFICAVRIANYRLLQPEFYRGMLFRLQIPSLKRK